MKNRWLAGRLHRAGVALGDKGDSEGALAKYSQALALDPDRAATHYNIGLIYKYQRRWRESFQSNQRAVDLAPTDEAANWNLAIAATALRDWTVARGVWNSLGMKVEPGSDPIDDNFGSTPVRLHPDGGAEVLWASRICPVRARLQNIPLPESGFRYGDVVLHDGAAVGYRRDADGSERAVFNVFELFEISSFATFEVRVVAPAQADIEALIERCDAAHIPCEDWTASVRYLCRACSEGRPHDLHDHEQARADWNPERRMGIATPDPLKLHEAVKDWTSASRHAQHIRAVLSST